ncbi:MAG TPA: zf-HC2 domain-containing protein [Pyrinomonadaceae bacterium]|jgi:anti-sigma factor RsiW|nr:zf-HC2 domain-containing protein [Pyrinomonadaceae bacterium]
MLCADFEDRLTDYIEGSLEAPVARAFAEHAMRCPVCHDLLSEVKNSIRACQMSEPAPPPAELEARILMQTMPETAMTCAEFEECLTDYLDGFLPANLYHRWERHAALCASCTELPGQVVRSIGACYTYITEERPVPAGLHERILQATLGTTDAEEVRAPLGARFAAWMRLWLDPIVSPQLATVATMLLVAVLVLTSTVSADGSISGLYRASVRMAEKSYEANAAVKGIASGITDFMSGQRPDAVVPARMEADKPEAPREQKNR